ncbi:hypothetical protein EWM64_g6641 [Hericium alpestre]|uniref:Uncharacterized protein n=1 Tax=Hericium alpestre TaxID=135208 RepID=A0A4Y9ZTM5_9AGAM|nr:hypothetical protein EWM64_g6641 [Hericium alpestre]
MYSHPLGHLGPLQTSVNRTAEEAAAEKKKKKGDNLRYMSKSSLQEWAIEKVEDIIEEEGAVVSSKDGGFHLPSKQASWDFILNFSMANALTLIEDKGPVLLRLLVAAAYSKAERPKPQLLSATGPSEVPQIENDNELQERTGDHDGSGVAGNSSAHSANQVAADGDKAQFSYAEHLSNMAPKGTGENRTNSFMIIMTAYLMLMNARNLRFTLFQKILAVWLFANNAAYEIFIIFAWLGLSVSYTTLLDLLRSISKSAQDTVCSKAQFRAFLLIYDNINRMIRAWDPDLGQKDVIQNGTAATFVVLEDCNVEAAFDVKALQDARSEGRRHELTAVGLFKQVDWSNLEQNIECEKVALQTSTH